MVFHQHNILVYASVTDCRVCTFLLSVQMLSPPGQEEFGTFSESFRQNSLSLNSTHYQIQMNRLMQEHSSNASVIFTSLPAIPNDLRKAKDFYSAMDTLSCKYTMLSVCIYSYG